MDYLNSKKKPLAKQCLNAFIKLVLSLYKYFVNHMINPVLILIRTSKTLRKLGVFIFQTFQFETGLILFLVLYSI